MKGFFRAKLIFALVTVVMLAAGIAVPLLSGSAKLSHAQAPRRQLIIFLPGIDTKLTASDITAAQDGNFNDFNQTLVTISGIHFPNPKAAFYSYPVDFPKGTPASERRKVLEMVHPYSCVDTFTHTIDQDVRTLDLQIKNQLASNPNTDIYLIGHSLGGVVALGYVEFLIEKLGGVSLPSTASLKTVITLDSPIGGVHDSNYLTDTRYIFRTPKITFTIGHIPITFTNSAFCKGLESDQFKSPTELTKAFASASKDVAVDDTGPFVADPQGAGASILAIPSITLPTPLPFPSPLGNPLPTNEELAEQAQTQFGTSFLSIGNERDFLWKPGTCAQFLNKHADTSLPTNIPDFIDTQWLEDEGNGNGLYGRDFADGYSICAGITFANGLNHTKVLTNTHVQTAIGNFLTPIKSGAVGGAPTPLSIPPGVTPEP